MLYPLKFKPVYKDYLWGGRTLENWGRSLPAGIIAESWEISGHPAGVSQISNGVAAGELFPDYLRELKEQITGNSLGSAAWQDFPLMIKVLDARKPLSVQVHPRDQQVESTGEVVRGKMEFWYVLAAEPGAQIVAHLQPGVTREDFVGALNRAEVEQKLNYITVQPGTGILIPAGMVHALGAGIVVVEIQQSSDVTYRVYDYERRDAAGQKRPLHIAQALETIDFGLDFENGNFLTLPEETTLLNQLQPGLTRRSLVKTDFFNVELIEVNEAVEATADGSRFFCYIIIEGQGLLRFEGGQMELAALESVLIPATLGPYQLSGSFKALRVVLP